MTSDTSPQPISPLRARMIEDMTRARLHREDASATTSATCTHLRPSSAAHPTQRRRTICAVFQLHQTAERHAAAEHQQRGLGPALLLHGDARPAGFGPPAHRRAPAAPAADGAERRGGDAAAAGGTGAEVQGGVRHRLRRRAARLRSRRAQGRRHRLRAHAAAGRARQGTQGPPRHAVAATARTAARVVARGPTARCIAAGRLAVSRPQSGRAAVDPSAQPRRSRRRRGRRDQEAGVAAHAAAQLRHPPARTGHRHPRHPGAARPRQARHHGAVTPASPTPRSAP